LLRFIILRLTYSNTRHERTETRTMSIARNPNIYPEKTVAGISAMTTSRIIEEVVISSRTCGELDTCNFINKEYRLKTLAKTRSL